MNDDARDSQRPSHPGRLRPSRTRGTGCIFRRARSPFWWIGYYANARYFRESTHTVDRKKAARLLARRLREIAHDTFTAPETIRVQVSELIDALLLDYKNQSRKSEAWCERRWRLHLAPVFGELRAVDVTTDRLQNYIHGRKSEGAENASINRELAVLKRAFTLGLQSSPPKIVRIPHFPALRETNVRQGFIEAEQFDKLAQAAAKVGLWLRAMLEVFYSYGWRKSEVFNLRVRQVDFVARTITLAVGSTKNDEGRVAIMDDDVYHLLRACVQGKNADDYVFTRDDGKRVRDFRGAWDVITREAGVPDLLVHDFRRTAARNMIRLGVSEPVAMRVTGHRTRSVFARYNVVSESDLREVARKLEKFKHTTRTLGENCINYGANDKKQIVN